MGVSYDIFTDAFLDKVQEYDLLEVDSVDRESIVDGYMKRAISAFRHICKYDFVGTADDDRREFGIQILPDDMDELVDIISDGMIVQWMRRYMHNQELFTNAVTTKDFPTYSPAALLAQVGNAYKEASARYIQRMREYSYAHGDLTDLHL